MKKTLRDTSAGVQRQVGERVRQMRLQRSMTIDELAKSAGITKGFLSKIEHGTKAPAISTLINLANALKVELTSIFETNEPAGSISFVRKSQRPPAVRFENAFGYKYIALADRFSRKHMQPFLVVLSPNSDKNGCGLQHPGEEFVLALKGTTVWTLDGQEYILRPGDSLYFDSSIPHWGRSHGKEDSEVLDISFPLPG